MTEHRFHTPEPVELEIKVPVGDVDVGGPDVVTYPRLLALYAEAAHLSRVQVPLVGAPVTAVSLTAGLVSAAREAAR